MTEPAAPVAAKAPRIDSVDFLRGLVIVIMALDHVRDYTTNIRFDPLDPDQTNAALYLTRWITHFCAPVFVFLAGASAGFQRHKGKSGAELSLFLLTRGLWLIFLEITFIQLGWFYSWSLSQIFFQVIFAIGAGMIVLAALVRLPLAAVAAFGAILVLGHNLFDGIGPPPFSGASKSAGDALLMLLHVPGFIQAGPLGIFVAYPLVPWIGVMALGYVFAEAYRKPDDQRRALLLKIGLGLTAAFFLLRGVNLYGDGAPWKSFDTTGKIVMSFFNTTKYPPSLIFLLMTLGPAIALLAVAEKWKGRVFDAFVIFGRVPLFFYVLHIYLAHLVAVLLGVAQGYPAPALMKFVFYFPPEYGVGLPGVYAFWLLVVAALYPACLWFAGVKRRSKKWWLSYF